MTPPFEQIESGGRIISQSRAGGAHFKQIEVEDAPNEGTLLGDLNVTEGLLDQA